MEVWVLGGLVFQALSVHIPFSGYTSSLAVNLTPFPPKTSGQRGTRRRKKVRGNRRDMENYKECRDRVRESKREVK